MSSGNFETLFFQKAVPLLNDVTGYSTFTMFAVGPNGWLEGYSFREYQSTCGFQDSITLVTNINTDFSSTLSSEISSLKLNARSTLAHVNNNIAFIGKTYVSTIPLLQWVSSGSISYNPFFVSTGIVADSYPIDFSSTGILQYGNSIVTPSFWLGSDLSQLINSGYYTTYVDVEYSLFLSTNITTFTWTSTLGVFNLLDDPTHLYGNKGISFTTRTGNYQYSHIKTKLLFNPEPAGYNTQIPANVSNFHFEIFLNSNTMTPIDSYPPAFDIFMPGKNNVTFTLVPLQPIPMP